MNEIFKRFCRSGELIAVYHENSKPDTFDLGTVLCVGDDFVLMQLLSLDGCYDGIAVFSIAEVVRIEVDTQYAAKLNTLMGCLRREVQGWQPAADECNLLESVLLEIKRTKRLATVMLCSSDESVLGTIEEFGSNWLSVRQIDDYGRPDGICYFQTADIASLYCNSAAEQRIECLIVASQHDTLNG